MDKDGESKCWACKREGVETLVRAATMSGIVSRLARDLCQTLARQMGRLCPKFLGSHLLQFFFSFIFFSFHYTYEGFFLLAFWKSFVWFIVLLRWCG